MSKTKLAILIIIIAAVVAGLIIWNSRSDREPQTPEEIQREIERLQKLIREIEEDNQKVERGEVACILLYDPVCGKDSRTYSNSCFAGVAGVEIEHQGECK